MRQILARDLPVPANVANIAVRIIVRENGGKKAALSIECPGIGFDFPGFPSRLGIEGHEAPKQPVVPSASQSGIPREPVPDASPLAFVIMAKQAIRDFC